jgi:hypothetical protein
MSASAGAHPFTRVHRGSQQRGTSDEHKIPGRSDDIERAQPTALLNGGKHAARKM